MQNVLRPVCHTSGDDSGGNPWSYFRTWRSYVYLKMCKKRRPNSVKLYCGNTADCGCILVTDDSSATKSQTWNCVAISSKSICLRARFRKMNHQFAATECPDVPYRFCDGNSKATADECHSRITNRLYVQWHAPKIMEIETVLHVTKNLTVAVEERRRFSCLTKFPQKAIGESRHEDLAKPRAYALKVYRPTVCS
jgi:hypothetical protein